LCPSETVDTGDRNEIDAHLLSLRARFNGFYPDDFVEVTMSFDQEGALDGFASCVAMTD